MNRKGMAVTAAVITALALLTGPAFSQVVKRAESNTSRATMGYFGTDVDDYMSYHNFSNVEFRMNPNRRNVLTSSYNEINGAYSNRTLSQNGAGRSESRNDLNVSTGANVSMGEMGFGLNYGINIGMFSNSYDFQGLTHEDKIKGTITWNSLSIAENKGSLFDQLNRNVSTRTIPIEDDVTGNWWRYD